MRKKRPGRPKKKAWRPRPGRPPKYGEDGPMELISVRFPKKQLEEARIRAKQDNENLSDLIRRALTNLLAVVMVLALVFTVSFLCALQYKDVYSPNPFGPFSGGIIITILDIYFLVSIIIVLALFVVTLYTRGIKRKRKSRN